jgi:hypothetical protein
MLFIRVIVLLICMLIIDGVKYQLWTPKDEEKEFHPMVRANSKEIFGQDSIYFDVKMSLKSPSGIVSIPDAYVINLSKHSEWHIIENELSTHSIYDHVVKQLTKFINGIENQNARSQILDMIYLKIKEDENLKAKVKNLIDTDDIHDFLSKLLSSPPRIVIVIDQKTAELEEATQVLKYHTDIIEFKTFARENAENIRAYLFEPLHAAEQIGKGTKAPGQSFPKSGEITSQPEYALPILESLIFLGGSAKMSAVLEKVHEKMKDRLKTKDYEKLSTGAIRWKNFAQWQRNTLKSSGYLKKDSPFGIWEITDEGRRYYENQNPIK